MTPEKIFQALEQLEAAGAHARKGRDSLYQVLTAQEMADRMQCSLPVIVARLESWIQRIEPLEDLAARD